ncbi:alcohol dehydrogenase [Pseudomonas aeruginosa VRFPA09]|nr:alcohol dehydrogenase [Pseudomonas aeruginosa VRFPA09]
MKPTAFLALSALACGIAQAAAAPDPALVRQGEYLARAGDCVACHTARDGKPFAGGLPMETPIGAVYSTNITPDRKTGIGDYSFEDFDRAVRHGVARSGDTLYPAMPYPSYARVSQADMRALYAYFMHGVEPVEQPNKASDIPWPLSMRWPLAFWRWTFAPEVKDFQAAAGQDPVLARGAYLVEGLGHCGACHTPRGLGMQEKALAASDGAAYLSGSAPLENWIAKSLRGDHRTGLGSWSEADLVSFLRTGRSERSAVFGGMSDVVVHSMQYMTDADLTAIARYLKSLPPADPSDQPHVYDESVAQALFHGDDSKTGAALYVDNCGACHRTDGKGYARVFPALAGNPVVTGSDPTSLVHIVLKGGTLPATHQAPSSFTMPPFGWRMNDQEIADVVNFIRTSWGNQAPSVSVDEVKRLRKDTGAAAVGRGGSRLSARPLAKRHSSPSPARGRGLGSGSAPYRARPSSFTHHPSAHAAPARRTTRPPSATPGSPDGSAATGRWRSPRGWRPLPAGRRRRAAGRRGSPPGRGRRGPSRRPPARRCSGRPAAPQDSVDDARPRSGGREGNRPGRSSAAWRAPSRRGPPGSVRWRRARSAPRRGCARPGVPAACGSCAGRCRRRAG